jgi:hypothetical protein
MAIAWTFQWRFARVNESDAHNLGEAASIPETIIAHQSGR